MDLATPASPPRPPPPYLGELLAAASRVGASLGTFMRIDFLGTDSLAAFNEFSSTPTVNRPEFTPYCNELFGRLWHDTFPDAI